MSISPCTAGRKPFPAGIHCVGNSSFVKEGAMEKTKAAHRHRNHDRDTYTHLHEHHADHCHGDCDAHEGIALRREATQAGVYR